MEFEWDSEYAEFRRELRAFRALLPYLWPKGNFELRGRVVLALLLLNEHI